MGISGGSGGLRHRGRSAVVLHVCAKSSKFGDWKLDYSGWNSGVLLLCGEASSRESTRRNRKELIGLTRHSSRSRFLGAKAAPRDDKHKQSYLFRSFAAFS